MSRARRLLSLLAVLAYLATSTLGAGWVVCSGDDGHVAIEALGARCCDDEEAPLPDDGCGDCSDVLLAHAHAAAQPDDRPLDLPAPALAVATRGLGPLVATASDLRALAPRGPPRPPPRAPHLATTVLRC